MRRTASQPPAGLLSLHKQASMGNEDFASINRRLQELRQEHRDLDHAIERLADNPAMDQLQLRRTQKRKLRLGDQIAWYQSGLIPDLHARMWSAWGSWAPAP